MYMCKYYRVYLIILYISVQCKLNSLSLFNKKREVYLYNIRMYDLSIILTVSYISLYYGLCVWSADIMYLLSI